jgi:hypothetical protein
MDKPAITPIVVKGCGHHLLIDLMDFRSNMDGDKAWCGQIKDPFSCYCWLKAFADKESMTIAVWLANWIENYGRPKRLFVPPYYMYP